MGRVSESSGYAVQLVRGPFVRLPPHPDAVEDLDGLVRYAEEAKRPLAVDLFCGAGGLSLGLEAAGYSVIAGVDHDDDALATHRANHGGLSANLDLADPDVVERIASTFRDIGVDLVAGGPPCQPFSKAGRSGMRNLVRKGLRPAEDMRRGLWQSFLRVVAVAQPTAVLMENVPDMALDRGMWILRTMVDELEELGYSVAERVMSTSDLGVPQFRQRFFLVALRDRVAFRWPTGDGVRTSVRNAIGDLPQLEGGWRPRNGDDPDDPVASGWAEYAEPVSTFQKRMRAGLPAEHQRRVYDHVTRPVRDDDAEAFALMDSSTRYSDLPEELQRYRDDIFDDKYKRLDWDGLSRTIVAHIAKDGYWYIHPDQPRTISVREAARLQTFPDHVRFSGPPTSAFRQIGNAVPPMAGEGLGAAILDSLLTAEREGFTTAEASRLLARWFRSRESLAIPWLRGATRWQTVVGETALSRLPAPVAQLGWRLVAAMPNPNSTILASDALRLGLAPLGRGDRANDLLDIASTIETAGIDPEDATEAELRALGVLAPAVIDLAYRVHPGLADDGSDGAVLATVATVRVASRYFGESVDENRNRLTEGRLAVARLIGGEDHSHDAHLALLELGNSVCSPGVPACAQCPLSGSCAFATTRGFQLQLLDPADAADDVGIV
ncbi:MAG: DNA (cytosine-5-)-methyltransferase [Acidimicrobiaceae bacterium]|nr:DNA (cytosine-5-)-methyltransferase [Acidimicrobiaceae bacterium]